MIIITLISRYIMIILATAHLTGNCEMVDEK